LKQPAANSPDFTATLPSDGNYTLALMGNSTMPVNYSFQVSQIAVPSVTSSGFGIFNGNLSAGQVDTRNFTASAGTILYLDGQTESTFNLRLRIVNPDGTFLLNDARVISDFGPLVLEQGGNYQVQVYGLTNTITGSYQVALHEFPRTLQAVTASPTPVKVTICTALPGRKF
jgi:hypothetical protein